MFRGTVPPWFALGLDEVGLIYVREGEEPLCPDDDQYGGGCKLTPLNKQWFEYKIYSGDWNS